MAQCRLFRHIAVPLRCEQLNCISATHANLTSEEFGGCHLDVSEGAMVGTRETTWWCNRLKCS
jgi:hypothetical protein